MKRRHLIWGIGFWIAALAGGWFLLRAELETQSSSVAALSDDLHQWVTGQKQTLAASTEFAKRVAVNDPIFVQNADGTFRHVGLVTDLDTTYHKENLAALRELALSSPEMLARQDGLDGVGLTSLSDNIDKEKPILAKEAEIQVYANALENCPNGFELHYYTTPMALDWVVETMIPSARRKEIAAMITEEWKLQREELVTQLRPVMREGLRTALKAVESELPQILRNHRDDFHTLGDRYEAEVLKAEIIPLVREEILPIVEEEGVPVATEVGKALWNRVSLWSFTWRYVYDKSPFPKRNKNKVKEEFQRFIDKEALPELRSRSDQFIGLTERIVKRSMENSEVKAAMKRNFKRVLEDDELRRLVLMIVRETVIENETLRTELQAYMKDQETKVAMSLAGERLEPIVRDIGDMIFGSRAAGITPEFSRILRSQILTKDRRWFVIVPTGAAENSTTEETPIRIVEASTPMMYPMAFRGTDQSPLTLQE